MLYDKLKLPEKVDIEIYKEAKEYYDLSFDIEKYKNFVYLFDMNYKMFYWNLLDLSKTFKDKNVLYMIIEKKENIIYLTGGFKDNNQSYVYNHFKLELKLNEDLKIKDFHKLKMVFSLLLNSNEIPYVYIYYTFSSRKYIEDIIKVFEKDTIIYKNNITLLTSKLFLLKTKEKILFKIFPFIISGIILGSLYNYHFYMKKQENKHKMEEITPKINKLKQENNRLEVDINTLQNKIKELNKFATNEIKIYRKEK